MEAFMKFHSVGQGLFYEGTLLQDKLPCFRFVYDCGTQQGKPMLLPALNDYNIRNDDAPIDLLVLSHFHLDHFNGIPELLARHRAKLIVFPEFNDLDRLVLIAQILKSHLSSQLKTEYIDIVLNLEAFFEEHSDHQMMIVGEPEERLADDFPMPEFGETYRTDEFDWEFFASGKAPRKITLAKTFVTISYAWWEFKFYHTAPTATARANYQQTIQKNLNGNSVSTVFSDSSLLKKFAASMKGKWISKENNNSLLLYHGPKRQSAYSVGCSTDCKCAFWAMGNCQRCGNMRTGSLLTGDFENLLADWPMIVQTFSQNRIDNIGFFQVPHHGGQDKFTAYNFAHCVISYGVKGSYYHPNGSTLTNIAHSPTRLELVNEYHDFCYWILL